MTVDNYLLEVKLCPTFHPTSLWTVARCAGATTVDVQICAGIDHPAYNTTLPVLPLLAESLYQTSCYVLTEYVDTRQILYRDGIDVCCVLFSDSLSVDAFTFWSPESEQLSHRLVEALFSVVSSQSLAPMLLDYMRSLKRYFDFDHSPF